MVARKIRPSLRSNTVAMTIMSLSLPRKGHLADAIVVLPGQGEDDRLIQAIKVWDESLAPRYLLVAGNYKGERSWFLPTLEILAEEPFGLFEKDGVKIQPHANNTPEQAAWLADQVIELGLTSLALVVSPYHMVRAYCTIVKEFAKRGIRIPIIPIPVEMSPADIIPEQEMTAWQMVAGEVRRLLTYQKKGDVLTAEELLEYLTWLWEQQILPLR